MHRLGGKLAGADKLSAPGYIDPTSRGNPVRKVARGTERGNWHKEAPQRGEQSLADQDQMPGRDRPARAYPRGDNGGTLRRAADSGAETKGQRPWGTTRPGDGRGEDDPTGAIRGSGTLPQWTVGERHRGNPNLRTETRGHMRGFRRTPDRIGCRSRSGDAPKTGSLLGATGSSGPYTDPQGTTASVARCGALCPYQGDIDESPARCRCPIGWQPLPGFLLSG